MKYSFSKDSTNLIITLDTESGKYAPEVTSLNDPNITLENGSFWIYENGKFLRFLSFDQISTIDGVIPSNVDDAFTKLNTILNTIHLLASPKFKGTAVPTDTPTGTEDAFWIATQAGTYTNFGGVVVSANSRAEISRVSGVFTISQTPLDLTTYQKTVDGNKINTWTAKSYLSGDQVNYLGKDWVSNAAIVAGDVPGTSSKWVDRLNGYLEPVDVVNKADLIVGKNLFNKLKTTAGYKIEPTGVLVIDSNFTISDYISILPGSVYVSNYFMRRTCYYDLSLNVITGGSSTAIKIFTAPASAVFVRFSIAPSIDVFSLDAFQFELGTVATAYEPYKSFVNPNQIYLTDYVKNSNVPDLIKDKVDLLIGKNKYNKLVCVDGFYVKIADGTLLANATWSTSEYIKVESSTSYFFNSYANWSAWYDSNKVFISGFQPINTTVTSPSNAKYVRVSTGALANKELLQIELGTVATAYEPYATSLNPNQINTLPIYGIWKDKVGLALGDSITASLKYQPYVKEKLALKEYRTKALGGADILTIINGNGGSYLPLTSADLVGVDFITFFGGINNRSQLVGNITDLYPAQDTVIGRYRYAINKLFSLANEIGRKDIRIIFIAPHKIGKYGYVNYTGGEEYPVGSGQTLETIVNKLKELCGFYAIPVADLYHNSGISDFTWDIYTLNNVTPEATYPTLPDNVHLNLLGSEMISRVIASTIKNS